MRHSSSPIREAGGVRGDHPGHRTVPRSSAMGDSASAACCPPTDGRGADLDVSGARTIRRADFTSLALQIRLARLLVGSADDDLFGLPRSLRRFARRDLAPRSTCVADQFNERRRRSLKQATRTVELRYCSRSTSTSNCWRRAEQARVTPRSTRAQSCGMLG